MPTSLSYPVRTVLRRWRGMVGMMLGVGVALGIGMGMLGVNEATTDLFTRDYRLSGADLRIIANGGTLVPLLPSDSPGTIKHASNVLSQVRGLPDVSEAVGLVSWELERERLGPRLHDLSAEMVGVVGVDGEPSRIAGTVVLYRGPLDSARRRAGSRSEAEPRKGDPARPVPAAERP